MNSYSLGIAGNNWLIFIILSIFAVAVTWWIYRRTLPPVGANRKLLLGGLRAFALIIMIFALFEPVWTHIKGDVIKPRVAVLLDNSTSAGFKDPGADRKEIFKKLFNDAGLSKLNKMNAEFYLFDDKSRTIRSISPDSLDYKGSATDISQVIRAAGRNGEKENLQAVLMITDGAFNEGTNPVYDAEKLAKPFYMVGIGDTAEQKDIALDRILMNEIAYIDTKIPVNVSLKSQGFQSGKINAVLKDNDRIIANQDFDLAPGQTDYNLVFDYEPKEAGVRKITVEVKPLNGEITEKNNKISEFLRVLKNKKVISIFSSAPNSDISFLTQFLKQDENSEVHEFVQKSGSSFFTEPTQEDINKTEIFVFIDFPASSTPDNILTMISQEIDRGKPLFFIAGYNVDYARVRKMEKYLPFSTAQSNKREFYASIDVNSGELNGPLLRATGTDNDLKFWNDLPPVFRTETFVRTKPESRDVANFRVNNVSLGEPLIISRDFQNQKSVAVIGYGLYRWKLTGFAEDAAKGREGSPDMYDVFMSNVFRWLSIKESEKKVSIKTTKKFYEAGERVEFTAQVYDASYVPVDGADIRVKITKGNQSNELTLTGAGNGRYTGFADGLGEGDYAFGGSAVANGKVLGADDGRFSVGDVGLEYRLLRMNDKLLQNIAVQTGGKFYYPEQARNIIDDISNNPAFRERPITQKYETALWSKPWLMILAILLLSLEWFLRKRSGML